MRISDWSSDVCSSDLVREAGDQELHASIIIFRSGSPLAPRPSEPHRRAGDEVAADHVIVRREGRRDRRVLVQQVVYVGVELKLRSVTRVHRQTRAQDELGVNGDAAILEWGGGEVPPR